MRNYAGLSLAASLVLTWSAAGQSPLFEEMIPRDAGGKGVFHLENKGVRVKSPAPEWRWLLERPNTLIMCASPFALGGDFEFSTSFDIRGLGVPGQPITDEGNAELSLWGRGWVGYVGINVGVRPDRKDCFNVFRFHQHKNGGHYHMITLPRKSKQGKLVARRVGDELIFEIADGKNVPLIEVVRFPFDASISPTPRFSAFQGNGRLPVPVDVLFDDVTLKADRILRGTDAQIPTPVSPPPKFKFMIDYSKKPSQVLADFTKTNDNGVKAFRVEGDAIRVRPPVKEQFGKGEDAYFFRDSRFSFTGDFECSMHFDVKQFGPVGPEGYGTLAVGMTLETETKLGSYSISRGFHRNEGHRFSITRHSPTSQGGNWDTQRFLTKAMTGRLILRRSGSQLVALVEEGDGAPTVELARMPFTTLPIKRLRLLTDMGGNPTNPVDVLVSNVIVKAGRIDDPEKIHAPIESETIVSGNAAPDQQEPIVLESAPRPPSNRGLYVTILAGGGVLAILAVLIVAMRRSKSGRAGSR